MGAREAAADGERAKFAEFTLLPTSASTGRKTGVLLEMYQERRTLSSRFLILKHPARTTIPLVILMAAVPLFAQSPPASPDRPWHGPVERQIANDGKRVRQPPLPIDRDKAYSLAELIDLPEAHNPETRAAWESARAQGAA